MFLIFFLLFVNLIFCQDFTIIFNENEQFLFFSGDRSFEAANIQCQNLFPDLENSFLAKISNLEEHEFIVQFVEDNNINEDFWIGLQRDENIPNPQASDFLFLDGDLDNSFTDQSIQQFPWENGEPNDDGNEECVVWQPGEGNLYDDRSCSDNNAFLCRTVLFTPEPTLNPTLKPTKAPKEIFLEVEENEGNGLQIILRVVSGALGVLILIILSLIIFLHQQKMKKLKNLARFDKWFENIEN